MSILLPLAEDALPEDWLCFASLSSQLADVLGEAGATSSDPKTEAMW